MAYEVDCIEKVDRYDPTEAITHLGGPNVLTGRWRLSQNEVVRRIKQGEYFYVSRFGRHVRLVVAVSRFGNEYVKTEPDDYAPNNLLELRSCTWAA